jgi:hypothetical protein
VQQILSMSVSCLDLKYLTDTEDRSIQTAQKLTK